MAEKQLAIISGAATGIGRGAAVKLAEEGFDLVLGDWNREEGDKTAKLCQEKGATADFVYVDMGKEPEVEAFFKFAWDKYGKIDFYFNNQGAIHSPTDFENITTEDFDKVVHSNFLGLFLGMKHAIRHMKEQKRGNILNTGSSSGLRPEPGFAVYSATKHAAIGLTKAAAMECGRYGIKVNILCPGGFMTPIVEYVGSQVMTKNYQFPRPPMPVIVNEKNPGNLADVSQIVDTVAFFAKDDTSYITGAVFSVDGGITI